MIEQFKRPYVFFLLVAASAAIGAGIVTLAVPSAIEGLSEFESGPSCNVLGIKVHGPITSLSEQGSSSSGSQDPQGDATSVADSTYTASADVEAAIRSVIDDPSIKGLYVDVDSEGGGAVGGDEIARAFKKLGKPSVAVVHELAASSGYLSAAGTDHIVASKDSMVGSIGATYSYVSDAQKNQKEGIVFEQLSSGPYKDMFNPAKPLTNAERTLMMKLIQESRDNFVKDVAMYRHLPYEKVDALADGSVLMGPQALDAGLIDQIGGSWEAMDYLSQKIGEPVQICWQ